MKQINRHHLLFSLMLCAVLLLLTFEDKILESVQKYAGHLVQEGRRILGDNFREMTTKNHSKEENKNYRNNGDSIKISQRQTRLRKNIHVSSSVSTNKHATHSKLRFNFAVPEVLRTYLLSPSRDHSIPQFSQPRCPNQIRHGNINESHSFQPADRTNYMYVFSAFLDERDHVVRVVGLRVRVGTGRRYFCHLWCPATRDNVQGMSVTPASVEVLPEHHARKYTAVYIHCPLDDTCHPYAVSVTSQLCEHDSKLNVINVLPVVQPSRTPLHNFTVCIRPLHLGYNRAFEVVEFIELNRILGASKFQVYVHWAGSAVLEILRWYQAQGVVELIDWNIPTNIRVDQDPSLQASQQNGVQIHAVGQLASINDCLQRNRLNSRYLVVVDWDEILVPARHGNWMDLLREVTFRQGPAAVYLFACLFFRKDFPRNDQDFAGRALAEKFHSNTLLVNKREKKPIPFPRRAKYIMDPQFIHMAGIHCVWKHRAMNNMQRKKKQIFLQRRLGSSYHYRNWSQPAQYPRNGVEDNDMYRFKDVLLQRLEDTWKHFPNISLDDPSIA